MSDKFPTISPSMTVQQIADLLTEHNDKDHDCYVRIESVRGRPVAFFVRERANRDWVPPFLRQAE